MRRLLCRFAPLLAVVVLATAARADYDLGVAARQSGDWPVAYAMLQAALADGDARAALVLGDMVAAGEGTAADPYRACVYYQRAAEDGLGEGEYRTAQCFSSAVFAGGTQMALDWYDRAAAKGVAEANCAAGRLLIAEGSADQGFARCLAGAEAGDAAAMNDVAHWLWNGEGTPADRQGALSWWWKAARAGNPDAALSLGLRYKVGDGVKADAKRAEELLRRAFELGRLNAAALLADLLAPLALRDDGSVDPTIGTAALFWAGLAEHVDDNEELRASSRTIHDELAAKASSLVARADRMVADWLAAHPALDRGA